MKTEHYPSLELCEKLTDIGWNTETEKVIKVDGRITEFMDGFDEIDLFCPSVMEMLDVMPQKLFSHPSPNLLMQQGYCWYTSVYENELPFKSFGGDGSLPNALAKMILWLHEKNLIKF